MDRTAPHIWLSENIRESRGFRAAQGVMKQPSWVRKFALLTFLIVIGIPIFLLILLALFLATAVFFTLVGINWIAKKIGLGNQSTGRHIEPKNARENVRIIR